MTVNEQTVALLMQSARTAAAAAYAPYSHFHVGAALLCEDGAVVTGVNVENASYGLTMCAERVAIGRAIAGGKRRFDAIAVAEAAGRSAFPCGGCRQVLAEFAGPDFLVIAADGERSFTSTLGELLPHTFRFDAPPA